MKIALELQPCCWDRSGIGTYTYEIAKRLEDKEGLEFCGNLFNFLGRRDNKEALSGIKMPITVNRAMPYGLYRRIWRYLPIPYHVLFPNKADIRIFFNFIVPPNLDGHVITAIHDLTYLRYPETMKASNLEHLKRGMSYSIERSDRIITVSEFSKWELQKLLGVPPEKIDIVYNAPSLVDEVADYQTTCEKYGIQPPYILFVGTIEPRKNINRLLRAFDLLKSVYHIPHQLVLAGGKGWRDEEIYRTAQTIHYSKDVVFTGYVSSAEKNTLYRSANVFVFPSVYEGFGIPPLEAMACGCPVVCADAASLPEVVGNAAELVDPLSEESIAQGIWQVLSDETRAKELIQRGFERARCFSWDASANQLCSICKNVGDRRV